MSYAQAASSGAHAQGGYYNEKLLVCFAGKNSCERLTEALHQEGYWNSIKVFQRVDFNLRYAVELENSILRDRLLTAKPKYHGLHFEFYRHQKRVEP